MNAPVRLLSFDDVVAQIRGREPATYQKNYLAMYSSLLGGVVRDPAWMSVPIDDHIVHRGDGIFEAIKCVNRQIYALMPHLQRLEYSASRIGLQLPCGVEEMARIVCQTVAYAEVPDALVRLYVSRGPGGFSPNPYETVGSQLYVVVTRLSSPPPERFEHGVVLRTSQVPVKQNMFAQIKSCNYLPNVLMKKEAVDSGADFTVSVDSDGWLAEGATENIGFIFSGPRFVVPRFTRTLKGITVSRILDLVQQKFVTNGQLQSAELGDVSQAQARRAQEILMLGTTIDILPVVKFDGAPVADGKPGEWSRRLLHILREDIASGRYSTRVV